MYLLRLGSYHFNYALFLMRKVGKLYYSEYRWALVNMDREDKYCMYLINFSISKAKSIQYAPFEIRNHCIHMKNAGL